MKIVQKYFKNLTERQIQQFGMLYDLYAEWNEKINVISRKDIEHLYERHILHSLSIGRYVTFEKNTQVLDIGTGGGLPGIPLAILYPNVSFTLIDSIGKKIKVATEISEAIGLDNVVLSHQRVQDNKRQYDFVVSRAVMQLDKLVQLCQKNIHRKQQNAIQNGLICLKGGDIVAEIAPFRRIVDVVDLSHYYNEPFFETKKVVYVPLS